MRAMVLCAGYGTRLGELTRQVPKAMLSIQGQPLLAYILAHLKAHRFDSIAINLHFRPEAIRAYFGDGSRWNLSLTYVEEPRLLGTAGAIKNMEWFLRGKGPFLVQYGDVLTDQDLSAMLAYHRRQHALGTLLLHQRWLSNSVVAQDAQGRIIAFLERPSEQERRRVQSNWVNSGLCILQPQVLDSIPPGSACDLPRDIFPKLIGTGRLFGFALSSYRCAIDSAARLWEADTAVREGRCRIKTLD